MLSRRWNPQLTNRLYIKLNSTYRLLPFIYLSYISKRATELTETCSDRTKCQCILTKHEGFFFWVKKKKYRVRSVRPVRPTFLCIIITIKTNEKEKDKTTTKINQTISKTEKSIKWIKLVRKTLLQEVIKTEMVCVSMFSQIVLLTFKSLIPSVP